MGPPVDTVSALQRRSQGRWDPEEPSPPARVDGEIVVTLEDKRTHVKVNRPAAQKQGGVQISGKSGPLLVGT